MCIRDRPTDEERQELIDQCVDAKLNDAMYTMDEALDGQGAQAVVFSLPLVLSDDLRMSSTFAQNHTGVDLAAPEGTTVLAAADGTVTEYDYNEDDGYYLVLYHGMDDGTSWQTRYSHLGSVKVQVGQQVVQGQEIAACAVSYTHLLIIAGRMESEVPSSGISAAPTKPIRLANSRYGT